MVNQLKLPLQRATCFNIFYENLLLIRFDFTFNVTGRDIMAGAPVHVGDVLGVESPFSAVTNATHLSKVCNHCLAETIVYVPCR